MLYVYDVCHIRLDYFVLICLFVESCLAFCKLFVTILQKKETFVKEFMKHLSKEIARNNEHYKSQMMKHR